MLNLLKIPKQCKVEKAVSIGKIFSDDKSEIANSVQSIKWIACLKPGILDIQAVMSETVRYEEIQIFYIELNDVDHIFEIARVIYKYVRYPCLLIMHYKYKYILSCCQFGAGKVNYSENILRAINFSHWIYPDMLSTGAEKMITAINQAINTKTDIKDIYTQVSHAIEFFRLSGITKAHVDRILGDMLGKISAKRRDEIMKFCTPYKKLSLTEHTIAAKYDKTKRSTNWFSYSYDCEDVWYCLMNREETKKIVMGRRYRDINDLIFTIDTKLEESSY